MIDVLWKQEAIRSIYEHRSTLIPYINDTSAYFWDHVHRLCQPDYVPTKEDQLKVKRPTTGLLEETFETGGVAQQKYQIVDVGGAKNERRKWMHHFENVRGVIYVASLSSFDELMFEDESQNAMVDQIQLFDNVCNNKHYVPWFKKSAMVLLLNKTDLFSDKIKKVPITVCPALSDFDGDVHDFQETSEFIRSRFEKCNKTHSNLYVHLVCALDRDRVESVLRFETSRYKLV